MKRAIKERLGLGVVAAPEIFPDPCVGSCGSLIRGRCPPTDNVLRVPEPFLFNKEGLVPGQSSSESLLRGSGRLPVGLKSGLSLVSLHTSIGSSNFEPCESSTDKLKNATLRYMSSSSLPSDWQKAWPGRVVPLTGDLAAGSGCCLELFEVC